MEFEACLELLKEFDIQYRLDQEWRGEVGKGRAPHDLKVISTVQLPLTPEEWCSLCQHEGDHYMGGCCGSMSHMQDLLNHYFREGGWVRGAELAELAEIMITHGEEFEKLPIQLVTFSSLQEVDVLTSFAREHWSTMDPLEKIALTWHLVKDHYCPKVPFAPNKDRTALDKALFVLSHSISYLNLSHIFQSNESLPGSATQGHATTTIMISRALPALKTVMDHLHEQGMPATEGWVIVDSHQGPEEVTSNGRGFCFYLNRSEIDALVALWRKNEAEHQETERESEYRQLGVRRARVSIQNGFEFLDDGPTPLAV